MKKILFWIFSAALAVAGTMPANAQSLARKAGGTNSQSVAVAAATQETPSRMPQMGRVRTGATSSLLQTAATRAHQVPVAGATRVAREASNVNFEGVLLYFEGMQAATEKGWCEVSGTGAYSLQFGLDGINTVYSAVVVDDVIYCSDYLNLFGFFQMFSVFGYDIEDGTPVFSYDGNPSNLFMGMAEDPTTGTVYGVGYDASATSLQLSTITFGNNNVTVTPIATMVDNYATLMCDAAGQLWGITQVFGQESVESMSLVKINKANGEVTVVGQLPITSDYITGGCIDPNTGKMYFAINTDAEAAIYEIDMTNAGATKVCDLMNGAEITGLRVPVTPNPATPEAPTNLSASFPEGSLSGTVTFTAPANNVDGNAGTTTLDYTLWVGTTLVEGTCAYGQTVNANATVSAAGQKDITVFVKNGDLKSKKAKMSMFIGQGTPNAPEVHATNANGVNTITWNAVTTTSDGGYINPALVSYTVVEVNSGTTVESNITGTSATHNVGTPVNMTAYKYAVTALYEGKTATGESNSIVLGEATLPYSNTFDSADAFEGLTILDANNDGKTWEYYDGKARIKYNSSAAMDDWMFLPPFTMEAGKAYKVTFTPKAHSTSFAETIAMYYGTETSPEAMVNTLLAPKTFLANDPFSDVPYSAYIVPETTGKYVVGIHGCSEKDKFYLYVDDIMIDEGISAGAPNVCESLDLMVEDPAEKKVTLMFNAPEIDFGGNALNGTLDVTIARDGQVIKTFTAQQPGAFIEYTDQVTEAGEYTYTVKASNAEGEGLPVSATVFLGYDYPAAPQNLTITEDGNTGNVTVTWAPVTEDVNGNAVDPNVKYDLYLYTSSGRTLIAGDLTTTSQTFQATPEGTQDLVQYAVWAKSERGEGEGNVTDMIFVGTPYSEYEESFANGGVSHDLMLQRLAGNDATWMLGNDSKFTDIASYDGDNGYIYGSASNLDASAALVLGKISLAGYVNPALNFYVANITTEEVPLNPNVLKVEAKVAGTDNYTTVFEKTVGEICGTVEGWSKASAALSAFDGQDVVIRIVYVVKQYKYTMIDALSIGSMIGNDLKAHAISAPAKVAAGSDYQVNVTIANEGFNAAEGHNVDLYLNGQKLITTPCEPLAAGAKATVTFNLNMHALAEEAHEIHAVIEHAADENLANNTTDVVVVTPKVSTLPRVEDLAAENVAEGVKLSWSEPNLEGGVAETKTENFDACESWAQELEGWTFIDGDQSPVGGFQGTDLPGIDAGTTTASFFVFDTDIIPEGNTKASFNANSGTKYLAALFRYDDGTTDDWAISPALSGNAQTISFYAKSYSSQYPEKISVLYSTGSLEPADFVATEISNKVLSADWTQISVELPAGAAYFAIKSHATGSFMLMVDDVTYESGSATANLSIIGYNVYRNGAKVNGEPVAEAEYTDAAPEGEHAYRVTTVYDRGESAGSNTASIQISGVTDVNAGVAAVTVADGNIVVTGAEGLLVTINNVAGMTVYSAQGNANVPVAAGIYLVKVDTEVVKVIVK